MKLAINTQLFNKNEHGNKKAMAKGFENVDVSPEELATLINAGYAFCPQVKGGHRNTKNFICSDFIAADIDEGWTVEEALATDFIQGQASIIYTTPSHSAENPRFRVVLELPRTISDPSEMGLALAGIGRKLRGDPSTKDAARLFFGSSGSQPIVLGNILDEENLAELIELGKGQHNFSDYADRKGRSSLRSTLTVEPDRLIRDRHGNLASLSELPSRTSIYCPFHLDKSPSAFTVKSRKGTPGIHCSACQRTFWTPNEEHYSYNFYDLDSVIRRLRTEEEIELIPDEHELYVTEHTGIKVISESKLPSFPFNLGLTLIKSPKNTGKTTFLEGIVEQCKKQRLSILLIGHRQSLLQANARRLGLSCYLEASTTNVGKPIISRYFAVSVDSLPSHLTPARNKFDVVMIDESEQVIAHLVSDTLKDKRRQCYSLLKHYVSRAKAVIALDADLNRITAEAIVDCYDEDSHPKLHVILNEYKESGKRLYLYDNDNHLYADLMQSIRQGKRCFICCNSKKRVEELREKILKDFGDTAPLFWITSDNSTSEEVKSFIQNIKEEILKYQVVIVSPTLGTGIDITFPHQAEHVDCVFGIFGPRINTHYDIDQQIYRVRQPKEIRVWISPQIFTFETARETIKCDLAENNVLQEVFKGYDQEGFPIYDLEDPFLDLYSSIVSAQRASKNNLRKHFIDLRTRNGWEVIRVERDKEQHQDGKAIKMDAKALRLDKRIADLLSVPTLERDEYRELLDKQDRKKELSRQERLQVERTSIELFYKEPLSRELIEWDDEGLLRRQIRMLDSLLFNPNPASARLRELSNRNSKVNPSNDSEVIGELLQLAGLFDAKTRIFDLQRVITMDSLQQFASHCRRNKAKIERVLNIEVRADVMKKPITQLNVFLKMVGLKAVKVDRLRSGGVALYQYRLDPLAYEWMKGMVENHRKRKDQNPQTRKPA